MANKIIKYKYYYLYYLLFLYNHPFLLLAKNATFDPSQVPPISLPSTNPALHSFLIEISSLPPPQYLIYLCEPNTHPSHCHSSTDRQFGWHCSISAIPGYSITTTRDYVYLASTVIYYNNSGHSISSVRSSILVIAQLSPNPSQAEPSEAGADLALSSVLTFCDTCECSAINIDWLIDTKGLEYHTEQIRVITVARPSMPYFLLGWLP